MQDTVLKKAIIIAYKNNTYSKRLPPPTILPFSPCRLTVLRRL